MSMPRAGRAECVLAGRVVQTKLRGWQHSACVATHPSISLSGPPKAKIKQGCRWQEIAANRRKAARRIAALPVELPAQVPMPLGGDDADDTRPPTTSHFRPVCRRRCSGQHHSPTKKRLGLPHLSPRPKWNRGVGHPALSGLPLANSGWARAGLFVGEPALRPSTRRHGLTSRLVVPACMSVIPATPYEFQSCNAPCAHARTVPLNLDCAQIGEA
ncbi:hypothetical protein B0T24DRAFT_234068 [Lasiosphaeria ovina]|uniref:Uncharacterized protein n=1 Tax=Lasiosphaeria ovina TaxID=92902 RepID=A0AAE0KJA6_9PEZI|nr:hypothetical protein B0T24DRAFT_234068 [Lasiosphaeria ovina]